MEYEEKVDGETKYLGWIRRTVMEYDKFKGYLVQFPDDMDWRLESQKQGCTNFRVVLFLFFLT